jgi:hypothetical protein
MRRHIGRMQCVPTIRKPANCFCRLFHVLTMDYCSSHSCAKLNASQASSASGLRESLMLYVVLSPLLSVQTQVQSFLQEGNTIATTNTTAIRVNIFFIFISLECKNI